MNAALQLWGRLVGKKGKLMWLGYGLCCGCRASEWEDIKQSFEASCGCSVGIHHPGRLKVNGCCWTGGCMFTSGDSMNGGVFTLRVCLSVSLWHYGRNCGLGDTYSRRTYHKDGLEYFSGSLCARLCKDLASTMVSQTLASRATLYIKVLSFYQVLGEEINSTLTEAKARKGEA